MTESMPSDRDERALATARSMTSFECLFRCLTSSEICIISVILKIYCCATSSWAYDSDGTVAGIYGMGSGCSACPSAFLLSADLCAIVINSLDRHG